MSNSREKQSSIEEWAQPEDPVIPWELPAEDPEEEIPFFDKEDIEVKPEDQMFNDFLAWEKASRDTIDFKKIYVDITGDLIAGLLLSQIIYWFLPNKDGQSKLRVIKKEQLCIAKGRHDWWDEVRISAKQVDRAMNILREKGIIKTEIHRFNNNPTTHIFLIQKTLLKLINKELTAMPRMPLLPKG